MMTYITGTAPYIRSPKTVSGMNWFTLVCLGPAVLVSLFLFRGDSLHVLGAAISAAMLAEIIGRKISGDKPTLHDGSAVLVGVLFGLMSPATLPSAIVAIGSFFAVFFGKEIFGLPGQSPWNAALVGQAFLHVSFSKSMEVLAVSDSAAGLLPVQWSWVLGAGMLGECSALALAAGGMFLIWKKFFYWEIPWIYLGAMMISLWFLGFRSWESLPWGNIVLTAFFLITSPASTPTTRMGLRVFALGSAFLCVILRSVTEYFYVTPFAILMMNALTPWIDMWF
ncbi:MAG: RnfABCDGE type electron transport complex subunit D, partial [Candidatus Omnitrophica bacterium]|nr:RnfABCDGE type electron transport complex subunit D [Candidatus Omnitrophota bacterium]